MMRFFTIWQTQLATFMECVGATILVASLNSAHNTNRLLRSRRRQQPSHGTAIQSGRLKYIAQKIDRGPCHEMPSITWFERG